MDKEDRKYFQQLIEKYPIEQRYTNILTQMQDLLEALNIMDKVEINEDLLAKAIIDYFEDIDRLKDYEDISRVNVEKIYAYEAFWLLRRKPIQITDSHIGIEYLHINEKIFTAILITKMLKEMHKGFDDVNPRMSAFMSLIYYNFKYRIFTQKSLEMMISGFFCGCCFSEVN